MIPLLSVLGKREFLFSLFLTRDSPLLRHYSSGRKISAPRDIPGHLLWRVGFIEIRRAPSIWSLPRLCRWSFSDVCRSGLARPHSRYLGLLWLIFPRNLGMSSVRKEENLNPKRSPKINTYVRARDAPWVSGFWIPAGVQDVRLISLRGEL